MGDRLAGLLLLVIPLVRLQLRLLVATLVAIDGPVQ
jgi:hypothetical protein